jgi:hypothetical protein
MVLWYLSFLVVKQRLHTHHKRHDVVNVVMTAPKQPKTSRTEIPDSFFQSRKVGVDTASLLAKLFALSPGTGTFENARRDEKKKSMLLHPFLMLWLSQLFN